MGVPSWLSLLYNRGVCCGLAARVLPSFDNLSIVLKLLASSGIISALKLLDILCWKVSILIS